MSLINSKNNRLNGKKTYGKVSEIDPCKFRIRQKLTKIIFLNHNCKKLELSGLKIEIKRGILDQLGTSIPEFGCVRMIEAYIK